MGKNYIWGKGKRMRTLLGFTARRLGRRQFFCTQASMLFMFFYNYLNLHSNCNAIYDLYFSTKIYICYTHWAFSCSKMHMLSMQLKPIICSISTPAPAWQVWCIKEKNDVALQMRLSPRAEKSHCSEIGPPACKGPVHWNGPRRESCTGNGLYLRRHL